VSCKARRESRTFEKYLDRCMPPASRFNTAAVWMALRSAKGRDGPLSPPATSRTSLRVEGITLIILRQYEHHSRHQFLTVVRISRRPVLKGDPFAASSRWSGQNIATSGCQYIDRVHQSSDATGTPDMRPSSKDLLALSRLPELLPFFCCDPLLTRSFIAEFYDQYRVMNFIRARLRFPLSNILWPLIRDLCRISLEFRD
jgi:hypothetical protein